jgi:MinD-like ATPase involved in chromosome partitioning or flagellar assembly
MSNATIVTFYSYKGGVGRSMALANIAWLLAEKSNRRVLAVDWDLEAPGLHRFFGLRDEDLSRGLMELFDDYKDLLRKESVSLPDKLFDLGKYVRPVKAFTDGGKISLLAAGRQDGNYAKRINEFSWEEFYAKWHGFGFIEHLKEELRAFDETDFILVDSRTGVTDIGGICTLQLPDVVVILFAMNEQNIAGAKLVAERILTKAGDVEGRKAPPILILRPARVERTSGNQAKKVEMQKKAAAYLGDYFHEMDAETLIAKKNIPYVSDFSYGETPLAVEADPLGDMTDSFDDLASTIIGTAGRREVAGVTVNRSRSWLRFFKTELQLLLAKKSNLYLLTLMFLLIVGGTVSFVWLRRLHAASETLQQQVDSKDQRIKQLEFAGTQAQPTPTPIAFNGALVTIQLADPTQKTAAEELKVALEQEGFAVSDDIEKIENPRDLPPQTWVKYFWENDEEKEEANDIMEIVRQSTGLSDSDSSVHLAFRDEKKPECHHSYEIWLVGAFKNVP